ncbi:hypothetical protein ABS71_20790 [bacterium SCN 62-11]|nr:MAG: hypothetical protein ABS71_20790 [bacterium SCN 62-11]
MATDFQTALGALKKTLPSLVRDEVERMIVAGELVPGDKLNESDLAERLQVSRGPVREAFRALEESGLVRLEKNRGVFVRQLTAEEAGEIQSVRQVLEEHAMRLLAANIKDEDLENIRPLIRRMERACQEHSVDVYFALNLEFHDLLIRATGNRKLHETYQRLVNELRLYRRLLLEDSSNLECSLAEHQSILEALEARDPQRAACAMKDHIEHSLRRSGSRVHP